MITLSRIFKNESDPATLRRIAKSMRIITQQAQVTETHFRTINLENHHRHDAELLGGKIVCSCMDSKKGNECKHEIALLRSLTGGMKI